MQLSEADRQLLSTLKRTLDAGEPTDKNSLEKAGERFEHYRWIGRGLSGHCLTPAS